MNQICDEILNACLTRLPQVSSYFSLKQFCIAKGALPDEVDAALIFLSKEYYIVKSGETFVLTPHGEEFAKRGGFTGQIERAAREDAVKNDERERARLVSQSVLDTNKSVLQTHAFQRKTTWLTLVVAGSAVAVSVIGLLKPTDTSQDKLIQRQIQMQREIDSLKTTFNESLSPDSVRSIHAK